MVDDGRYRLAPVRDARARTEAIRRGSLATAVGDARETEAALAAAHTRTHLALEALETAMAARAARAAASPAQLVLEERYVARRRREWADTCDAEQRAREAHDGRLGVVGIARGELAHARGQRELVERHFARWRETQRKLAERRADD